jgi:hypothetical protein
MNLAQIVTAIGQRTGQIGPRDVTATRNFVGIRYNQLWQAFLWKDALVEYVIAIDPDTAYVPTSPYMPTKGHLILPSIIGNVIAVRSNQDKMNVERPMMYFRVGQDQFTKTGQPCEFYLLSTCVWEFDVVTAITLAATNPSDQQQLVTIDSLADDGVSVNRVTTPLPIGSVPVDPTDRIDTVTKPATEGAVTISNPDSQSIIITLQATDTAAPKRQRIRFVRIPDNGLTIRVLGKRVTPQLSDDHDEPAVKGMDGLLYAMATYDMAHRDEFSKVGAAEAQILLTESVGPNFLTNGVAGGFLKKLIEEECDQAAFSSRIMPEEGFGGHELDGDCRSTKSNPYGL